MFNNYTVIIIFLTIYLFIGAQECERVVGCVLFSLWSIWIGGYMVDRMWGMRKKVRIEWEIFFHIVDMLNKSITTIMVLLNYFSKPRGQFEFKYDVMLKLEWVCFK